MMMRNPLLSRLLWVFALPLFVVFSASTALMAQRTAFATRSVPIGASDVDSGAVPASQMMALTVRLRPDLARVSALDALIAAQSTPGSASYRKWVTPDEFAEQFGGTDEQIAVVKGWLESQGLAVAGVSPSKLRLTISGSSAQVAAAFHVQLRQYRGVVASGVAGSYFANANAPSLPEAMGRLIADVSGLDDMPHANPMTVAALSEAGKVVAHGASLVDIEELVNANTVSNLIVTTKACFADFAAPEVASYQAILRQAEAQGLTVLSTSGCGAESFPAGLAEVTAVAGSNAALAEDAGLLRCAQNDGIDVSDGVYVSGCGDSNVLRPAWQFAEGLPQDGLRTAPDVMSDITALAETLATISVRAGTRLGNVGPVLYALAKAPGLYTQPDEASAGTWEPATGLGRVDLKQLAEDFPLGTTGTSSLLVPSNYAPTHGMSLTLTATVTSTGGSGIPTGTVTFTSTQKGTLGTSVLNASGVATFTTNQLPAGTYTTTSVYAGDAIYTGSTSGVATITVVPEVSVISATVASGAAVGGNASIAVSITSGSGVGTPSGTVTVAPQGTKNISTATATIAGSNGTATGTVLLPVYEAGQFTLLISCTDPDPSYTCNSPLSTQMTVGKGATTTSVMASPANPAAGTPYTLTATVAGSTSNAATGANAFATTRRAAGSRAAAATNVPTGNVQFMDGTNYLATAALSSGVATYSGTATTATHAFNAMYSGDQNYTVSSSNATPPATGTLPTSTSLTASSYAIAVGQTITFYSTVFSPGLPSTMTGTVTYSAAAQGVLGMGTVSSGLATLTLPSLSPGTYVMTATYSGDTVFAGSSSATTVVVTVAGGVATLAGSFNPASAPYGSDAMLTATASFPSGSVGGPAGTLVATISRVAGAMYTQTLIASTTTPTSAAVFSFPAPPTGVYTVTISCPAADTFMCSAPVKVPLTVVRGNTATALTLSPLGPLAGQPVTLTATVSNMGNDPKAYTFTGTVQFFANNQLLGASVVNGVTASIIAALPAGSEESITAVYSGDIDWTTSISAPTLITVAALPTTIVVTSNVSSAIAGVQVELTATVTNIAGGPLATTGPTGSVSFYDTFNSVVTKIGTAALVSQGANTSIAMLNATGLTAGSHSVYAVYLGDMIYLGSTSPAITLGLTSFGVTFVPATMTLKQGQTGSATLVVNFQGGLSGSVSFGCQPPPNVELTCSFSPAVLTASGTTTLNVGTVAASVVPVSGQSSNAGQHGGLDWRVAGGGLLAMLLLWMKPRRLLYGLLLAMLAAAGLGVTGCTGTNGASSNGGTTPPVTTPSDPGTSLGTQILTITTAGSDGTNTVRHDFQYQVTVQ